MQRRDFLKAGTALAPMTCLFGEGKPETHGGYRNAYIPYKQMMEILTGAVRIVPPAENINITNVWFDYQSTSFGLRFQSKEWPHVLEGHIPPTIQLEFVRNT